MREIYCPNCGSVNKQESKFCNKCGAQLRSGNRQYGTQQPPQQVLCPCCGTAQNANQQICSRCGQPLYLGNAKPVSQPMPVQSHPQTTPRQQKQTGSGQDSSGLGLWILIGALAALVVVGIFLVVLNWQNWFGKKPEDSSPALTGGTESVSESDGAGKNTEAPSEATSEAADENSTETQEPETRLSLDEAQARVRQRYDCPSSPMDQTDDDSYYFRCFYNDSSSEVWGEVAVDAYTGEIRVLSGMQASAVRSLSADRVEAIVKEVDPNASYSFAIVDLHSGDYLGSLNADSQMSSSVLIDIPILYAVSRQLIQGELGLQDAVPIHYTTAGRGILGQADDGTTRTVRELLSIMFRYSDNNATNSFMDFLGLRKINSLCQNEGYYSVSAANRIGETTDYTSGDNYVSARDLCWMLYELYNSNLELNRDFLLENFNVSDGSEQEGLNKYFSADRALCFNGMKATKYNEVLIVEKGSQAYVIALLSNNASLQDLQKIAAGIGSYISDSIG